MARYERRIGPVEAGQGISLALQSFAQQLRMGQERQRMQAENRFIGDLSADLLKAGTSEDVLKSAADWMPRMGQYGVTDPTKALSLIFSAAGSRPSAAKQTQEGAQLALTQQQEATSLQQAETYAETARNLSRDDLAELALSSEEYDSAFIKAMKPKFAESNIPIPVDWGTKARAQKQQVSQILRDFRGEFAEDTATELINFSLGKSETLPDVIRFRPKEFAPKTPPVTPAAQRSLDIDNTEITYTDQFGSARTLLVRDARKEAQALMDRSTVWELTEAERTALRDIQSAMSAASQSVLNPPGGTDDYLEQLLQNIKGAGDTTKSVPGTAQKLMGQ